MKVTLTENGFKIESESVAESLAIQHLTYNKTEGEIGEIITFCAPFKFDAEDSQ